jgi:hypothetical protein
MIKIKAVDLGNKDVGRAQDPPGFDSFIEDGRQPIPSVSLPAALRAVRNRRATKQTAEVPFLVRHPDRRRFPHGGGSQEQESPAEQNRADEQGDHAISHNIANAQLRNGK